MAGAGMRTAGRILHHFKTNVWKRETHVLIVGYQGDRPLGGRLLDGAKAVLIHSEKTAVRAEIHTFGGFRAHAGQTGLLTWCCILALCKPHVVLTHGEGRHAAFWQN
jgi:metallo-beta-lactamase family protein